MKHVWLAVGSNLYKPFQQVNTTINLLKSLPKTSFITCSSYYRSRPFGIHNQPDFLNTVVKLHTELTPEQLLDHTKKIEIYQGRVRTNQRWGPRIIDIDILLFDNLIINTPRLIVPHYDMHHREFMLYPLAELESNLIFPNRIKLDQYLSQVPRNGLDYW